VTERHEFLSEPWMQVVEGIFRSLAPQTVEILGGRHVTFAEVYTEAGTPAGSDGWFVTIGDGTVQRCERGHFEGTADMTATSTLAVAKQLAVADVLDSSLTMRRDFAPDADMQALMQLGPLFAHVHGEIAEQTLVS